MLCDRRTKVISLPHNVASRPVPDLTSVHAFGYPESRPTSEKWFRIETDNPDSIHRFPILLPKKIKKDDY